MHSAAPQSKLVHDLTIDNTKDIFSKDTMATFKERRTLKGKKLYTKYPLDKTIAISSKEVDDMELIKKLRSHLPSPPAFLGMVTVKREVLVAEEANKARMREEDHHLHLQKWLQKLFLYRTRLQN